MKRPRYRALYLEECRRRAEAEAIVRRLRVLVEALRVAGRPVAAMLAAEKAPWRGGSYNLTALEWYGLAATLGEDFESPGFHSIYWRDVPVARLDT